MKRYNIVIDKNLDNICILKSYEFPEGKWVKWDDFQELLNKLGCNEQIKSLGTISSIECNCAEVSKELRAMSNAGILGPKNTWICPAHGYKKF